LGHGSRSLEASWVAVLLVRLSAEVYDLGPRTSAGATQSEGPADSLPELVDRLSLQILRSGLLGDPSAAAHFHVSAFTTTSLPALKAYLEGEQQYRRARPVDAIAKFRRAVDADKHLRPRHCTASRGAELDYFAALCRG